VRYDRASVDARVLLAPSLDTGTRRDALEQARSAHVGVFDVDPAWGAARLLAAFDASLCASGTVALEAALARAVPVVAYRVGILTEVVARAFLRSPCVALPNVLLGREAFAELLQREATVDALARELRSSIDRRRELCLACDEVEELLGKGLSPSRAVADMLAPWLREASLVA
jgi:lipid-A-disaccharide synthase